MVTLHPVQIWMTPCAQVIFFFICGQRSNRVAERKRQALGNYFSERICYMFLISKCRGDWDLGLCTTSGLAFEEPQRNGKIGFFLRRNMFFSQKSPLRCGSPNASPEVVYQPRFQSPLYILILGTYSKFARKNNFQALGVCIPHDRALAAGLLRHDHVYSTTDESFRFHNKKSMECVVNWIPLKIRVRSRNTQPHLEGGPEPSKRMNPGGSS